MKGTGLLEILTEKLSGKIKQQEGHAIEVSPEVLKNALQICAEDPRLKFDYFECMTALDTGKELIVIYRLYATLFGVSGEIQARVSRDSGVVPSATAHWPGAKNYEREAAEMFGLKFQGHADLKPLFLPEGWVGHPMRKDYVYPEKFGGIEHRRSEVRKEHPKP